MRINQDVKEAKVTARILDMGRQLKDINSQLTGVKQSPTEDMMPP